MNEKLEFDFNPIWFNRKPYIENFINAKNSYKMSMKTLKLMKEITKQKMEKCLTTLNRKIQYILNVNVSQINNPNENPRKSSCGYQQCDLLNDIRLKI